MAAIEGVIMGRVVGVDITPKRMLQAVGAVEDADAQAF